MRKRLPMFYSALLLTLVNLLLRLVGTSFQVYLSGRIGAAGIGLLQLVMSVGSLAMIAGIAGIRTAAMYLTAEELGRGNQQNVPWVLSGCFLYSILCSGAVAVCLYIFAPQISVYWIGNAQTEDALRLFAALLPMTCLCGVMTGCFTAANRIGTLAAVEVAEQLISMVITITSLYFLAGSGPARACMCVIFGSAAGCCVTLLCLVGLTARDRLSPGVKIPVRSRLLHAAVPLALADILKSGITTTENLMVPKRLALNQNVADPLAAFGVVSGMVFPVLMFPACILYALAELLIPELARCAAAGSRQRIRYLVRRSLKAAMLYGLICGGLMFLLADLLGASLYDSEEAGTMLRLYAPLIPMLYCDAITDAMTKGLGQQKICVRYNIFTSAMDVILLFVLLPRFGMEGYFVSFALTHLINFLLSLRRLLKITGQAIPLFIPFFSILAAVCSAGLSGLLRNTSAQCLTYPALLISMLSLTDILSREDVLWILSLIRKGKSPAG